MNIYLMNENYLNQQKQSEHPQKLKALKKLIKVTMSVNH